MASRVVDSDTEMSDQREDAHTPGPDPGPGPGTGTGEDGAKDEDEGSEDEGSEEEEEDAEGSEGSEDGKGATSIDGPGHVEEEEEEEVVVAPVDGEEKNVMPPTASESAQEAEATEENVVSPKYVAKAPGGNKATVCSKGPNKGGWWLPPQSCIVRDYNYALDVDKSAEDNIMKGNIAGWPSGAFPLRTILVLMAKGRVDDPEAPNGWRLTEQLLPWWWCPLKSDPTRLYKIPVTVVRQLQKSIKKDPKYKSSSLGSVQQSCEYTGDDDHASEVHNPALPARPTGLPPVFDPSVLPESEGWVWFSRTKEPVGGKGTSTKKPAAELRATAATTNNKVAEKAAATKKAAAATKKAKKAAEAAEEAAEAAEAAEAKVAEEEAAEAAEAKVAEEEAAAAAEAAKVAEAAKPSPAKANRRASNAPTGSPLAPVAPPRAGAKRTHGGPASRVDAKKAKASTRAGDVVLEHSEDEDKQAQEPPPAAAPAPAEGRTPVAMSTNDMERFPSQTIVVNAHNGETTFAFEISIKVRT